MNCPTVKIQADNKQGFVIINESDFDEKTMKLFGSKKVVAKSAAPKKRTVKRKA